MGSKSKIRELNDSTVLRPGDTVMLVYRSGWQPAPPRLIVITEVDGGGRRRGGRLDPLPGFKFEVISVLIDDDLVDIADAKGVVRRMGGMAHETFKKHCTGASVWMRER